MEKGTVKLAHQEAYSGFHRLACVITLYYAAVAIHIGGNHVSSPISLLDHMLNAEECLNVGHLCGVSPRNTMQT